MFTTLISTDALQQHLGDAHFVVLDCRFDLRNPSAGGIAFELEHIPGARHVHLDRQLSGAKTGTNGRHPLPAPDDFARTLEQFGISNHSQVIVYDQQDGMYASRAWWMLKWMGHDAVALLDGGFSKWTSERRPTETGMSSAATPGTFVPHVRHEMLLTVDAVIAPTDRARVLVDARAPERYRGEVEPLDKAAGHIPGAVNRFFQNNLNADGTMRAPEDLAREFRALTGDPGHEIVCYCGSGVTACQNLLALEHAGIRGAKLYAGSWSEWSADPSRPISKG
ncbi:MAG: sulfurtransferase [Acidobacteriaceae bacterium]|jgi:thiosulfate/3-mercaptopyruvate sulfurtransferase|nr:sulfurtransferase [Acidobacteriaceae bacterium]